MPESSEVALYVTEHLPDTRVQVEALNVPVPLVDQATLPVGVLVDPGDVSASAASHVETPPTWTVLGLQLTVAAMLRLLTVRLVPPELVACAESPL